MPLIRSTSFSMADPVNAALVQALLGYASNATTVILRRGFNYHRAVSLTGMLDEAEAIVRSQPLYAV